MFARTLLRNSRISLQSIPRTAPTSISIQSSFKRAMTTSPSQEWLIIVPDFPEVLQKRLSVRGNHLAGLKQDPENFWQLGGAMLEEPVVEGETPKMKGSAMLCVAATKEEVLERMKRDIYVEGGVWDFEKIQVIPFKSAVRKAL